MALKDWKKKGKDSWTNGKDTNLYIDLTRGTGVDKEKFPGIKYQVLLYPLNDEGHGEGIGSPRNYLTRNKLQALRVAKAYMKKN